MRILYHATDYSNLGSILCEGLKPGCDGLVYGCKKPEECIRFPYVLGKRDVLVVEFEVDSKDCIETFDHSYDFYKCRAFASTKPVSTKHIRNYYHYNLQAIKGAQKAEWLTFQT